MHGYLGENEHIASHELMREESVAGIYEPHVQCPSHYEDRFTASSVVVDFTATWCGPCRIISPVFVELSKKFSEIFFLKVDVDELRDVAQEWDVEAMPTFIFIKDGKAVDKFVGANKAELERKVAALATQEALVTQA